MIFLSNLFTELNINHYLFTGTKKAFDVFFMLTTCATHVTFGLSEYSSSMSSPVVQRLECLNGVVAIFGFDSFYTSDAIFPSSLPMTPRALQPNRSLLSPQIHISSDWVRVCMQL